MSTALDLRTADRLAKVCAMFASPYDGERATAALRAHEIVENAGVTWQDVIVPRLPEPQRAAPPPPERPPNMTWRQRVMLCQDFPRVLTIWERQFIASLATRSRLSFKQERILNEIFVRVWRSL